MNEQLKKEAESQLESLAITEKQGIAKIKAEGFSYCDAFDEFHKRYPEHRNEIKKASEKLSKSFFSQEYLERKTNLKAWREEAKGIFYADYPRMSDEEWRESRQMESWTYTTLRCFANVPPTGTGEGAIMSSYDPTKSDCNLWSTFGLVEECPFEQGIYRLTPKGIQWRSEMP